jgi:hypothetical protein
MVSMAPYRSRIASLWTAASRRSHADILLVVVASALMAESGLTVISSLSERSWRKGVGGTAGLLGCVAFVRRVGAGGVRKKET